MSEEPSLKEKAVRQITTIEEKPRLQWSRLFLLAVDAAAIAWVIYVGLKIFGI